MFMSSLHVAHKYHIKPYKTNTCSFRRGSGEGWEVLNYSVKTGAIVDMNCRR